MNTETFEKIKKFTSKRAGVAEREITEDAALENLNLTGYDACEFIIAFGKEFKVDTSKFMAADYFSAEGEPIVSTIIRTLTGKKRPKRKSLKMKHLVKAAEVGRLDEDVINAAT